MLLALKEPVINKKEEGNMLIKENKRIHFFNSYLLIVVIAIVATHKCPTMQPLITTPGIEETGFSFQAKPTSAEIKNSSPVANHTPEKEKFFVKTESICQKREYMTRKVILDESKKSLSLTLPGKPSNKNIKNKNSLVKRLRKKSESDQRIAHEIAIKQGWSPYSMKNENEFELQFLNNEKALIYGINNTISALSTAASLAQANYPQLTGKGMNIGIWDVASPRTTHQELTNRLDTHDTSRLSNHSTGIAGTILGKGVKSEAKGMAPEATATTKDWNNDKAEMAELGMSYPGETNTIQISNHSYGFLAGWSYSTLPPRWFGNMDDGESFYFGQYDYSASKWDEICHAAPYFLPFKSSGNDRDDSAPIEGKTFNYWENGQWESYTYDSSIHPGSDNKNGGGYDTLVQHATAKNILTVGSIKSAVLNDKRNVERARIAGFSAWGPTDDGRIKPDIVANGWSVLTSSSSSDSAYGKATGTSSASANASGSAILILQRFKELFPNTFLRASSIKGLILHTADDLGNPGPDYTFGWGLMNTDEAIKYLDGLSQNPNVPQLIEREAELGNVIRHKLTWDGSTPIKATLCWTDPAGSPGKDVLNDRSLKLVHDLNIRIISPSGKTYLPYILDPENPSAHARTGRNFRDNVEQVFIQNPDEEGNYLLEVFVTGQLKEAQTYSLILSGGAEEVEVEEPPPSPDEKNKASEDKPKDDSEEEKEEKEEKTPPPASKDKDKNGMEDVWEITHFGSMGVDPQKDFDGDGMNNLDEYVCGTSPIDPDDVFVTRSRISFENGKPEMKLTWPHCEKRTYVIQRADRLSNSTPSFTLFTSVNYKIEDGWCVWTDTNLPESNAGYFYNVKVSLQEN